MSTDKQPRNNAAKKTVRSESDVPASSQPVSTAAPANFTARNPVMEGNSSFDMDEVRKRAYELYEQDGRVDGKHDDHWNRAEREIRERKNGSRNTQDKNAKSSQGSKRIA